MGVAIEGDSEDGVGVVNNEDNGGVVIEGDTECDKVSDCEDEPVNE